jgi:Fe-S cluster assembly iron-binding protein IscA
MLTITERAATELRELLEASAATPEQGVKLCPDGQGGVQVAVGTADAGDEVLRDDGHPLLIIDPVISDIVDGAILDSESVEIDGRDAVRLRLVR